MVVDVSRALSQFRSGPAMVSSSDQGNSLRSPQLQNGQPLPGQLAQVPR
jgi:hypothetical protein